MKTTVMLDVASLAAVSGCSAPGKSVRLRVPPVGTVLAAVCLVLGACGKAPDSGPSRGSPGVAMAAEAGAKSASDKTTAADSKEDAAPEKAPAADSKGEADDKATAKDAKPDAEDDKKGAEDEKGKEGVTLKQEELDKLGVTIQPAAAADYRAESVGYGVVLDHQTIAQAVADLQTAEATAQFSKASLERARQLHGTPGAMSADVEQTAEQKAAVDSAALTLTTEKLSTTWGMQPPWKGNARDSRVLSLAHGSTQLVRVTFPLGSLPTTPDELHGGRVGTTRPEAASSMHPVWVASADVTIPGRSFFAMLPAGTLAEGERLQVWAPTGKPTSGALIPTAAIVLNGGKFWCYVEKEPGTLVRVEVDTSRPVSGGYVVTEGVKPGDKIAVAAVSQLLAKETGSSAEPD